MDLAESSNHSFRTFNHAYAGSTPFGHEHDHAPGIQSIAELAHPIPGGRGPRPRDGRRCCCRGQKRPGFTIEPGMVGACKKARFRTRPLVTERVLIEAARKLHNDPGLQLRRQAQREAMLATMGTHAADQVIVVLATGSGKTPVSWSRP